MIAREQPCLVLLGRIEWAITVRAARNQFARFVIGQFAQRQMRKDVKEWRRVIQFLL